MKTKIAFFEIPAANFSRAVSFYEKVFGDTMPIAECETEKMAFFIDGDECTGAISWAKDFLPSPNGVLISLACTDIETLLSAIELNGGKVITPKTKVEAEGRGYFAVFSDTESNHIGLYSDK